MEIKKFDRKPFTVEAVQVTRENMKEVAEWCGGKVENKTTPTKNGQRHEKFVKVPTNKPINEKQTQAFATDWVLLSDKKFKVYTHRAFLYTFQEPEEPTVYDEPRQPAGNIFDNAQDEITADEASQIVREVDSRLPIGTSEMKRQMAIGEATDKYKAGKMANNLLAKQEAQG